MNNNNIHEKNFESAVFPIFHNEVSLNNNKIGPQEKVKMTPLKATSQGHANTIFFASDSTLKQLTTCRVSNTCTLLYTR